MSVFKSAYLHILLYYIVIVIIFVCVLYPVQSLTRFNEQLVKNSHLREELQTLHIERVRFQQLHNRLDKVRGHTMKIQRQGPKLDLAICWTSSVFSPLFTFLSLDKHVSALILNHYHCHFTLRFLLYKLVFLFLCYSFFKFTFLDTTFYLVFHYIYLSTIFISPLGNNKRVSYLI